jgi:hypothetical protein
MAVPSSAIFDQKHNLVDRLDWCLDIMKAQAEIVPPSL